MPSTICSAFLSHLHKVVLLAERIILVVLEQGTVEDILMKQGQIYCFNIMYTKDAPLSARLPGEAKWAFKLKLASPGIGKASTAKVFSNLYASCWLGGVLDDDIFAKQSEIYKISMINKRSAGPLISKLRKRELARKRSSDSSIISAVFGSPKSGSQIQKTVEKKDEEDIYLWVVMDPGTWCLLAGQRCFRRPVHLLLSYTLNDRPLLKWMLKDIICRWIKTYRHDLSWIWESNNETWLALSQSCHRRNWDGGTGLLSIQILCCL